MRNRAKRFILNNRYIFTSFLLPVVLVVIALAVTGVYPFGSQQIPVIDMYHQYVPFLSELQHKLHTGGSLLFTWDGAAGCNFWNLLAYYGASPLNLLLFFFPDTLLMEGVTTILLIKIGLAGAFLAVFLREETGTCTIATTAFATMYALCAYVMGYFWCIMWLDAVYLLPLVITGLTRIIRGRGPALYVITLALTVFCNYYIAIEICIFILCYYPVLYFIKAKGARPGSAGAAGQPALLPAAGAAGSGSAGSPGAAAVPAAAAGLAGPAGPASPRHAAARRCAITTAKAVGCSLLAIALAAVMLLPTWYSMQSTYYISSEFPDTWSVYNDVMDVVNQLLPNAQLTFREGLPNLSCGLLAVLLGILYVADRTIRLREKLLSLGFLAFLLLSMNVNTLDFIWHGFHFPNQLPYRYSFVVSFLLVGMAYRAFLHIDRVKPGTIWAAMAGILGWYVLAQRLLADKLDNTTLFFYLGAALLLAYTALLVLRRKKLLSRRIFLLMITGVVAVEAGFTVAISFEKVGNTDRDFYFENYQEVRELAEEVDGELDRVEINDSFILNTPAFYHYKGVSQFASSINANTTGTMEAIGVEGEPGKNRFNYVLTDPVTNTILDVKYLIGKGTELEDENLTLQDRSGDSCLYRNRCAPGMGYMTGAAIWSWDINLDNPFSVLDDYVRAATDNEIDSVFQPLEIGEVLAGNMTLDENGDSAWICEYEDGDAESYVDLEYTAEETKQYYVYVEADSCRDINVYKDGDDEGIFLREDCGAVVNIGTVEEGESFTVELDYDAGNMGSIVCHVASMDMEAWEEAYGMISSSTMEVEEWGDTYVRGTVEAEEDGVLVTAIPYEKGWRMKIDGESKDIDQLAGECFIAAELEAGTHEIELSFRPPGSLAGGIITVLSALLLFFLCAPQGSRLRRTLRERIIPSARR